MATQYSKTASDPKVILDLKVNSKEAIDAIIACKEQIAKLKEEQKQLEAEMKKGTGTKEMKERLVLINTEIKDLNTVMKANQKELTENLNAQKQNADSINAMRAQLKLMRQEYEDLSKSDRESTFGAKMLENISDLTDELKQLERAQGDATRGVGEYERALNGLEGNNARTALRELKMECQNLAVALSTTQGAIKAQTQVVNTLAQTVGTETDAYKEAVAELDRLNAAYDETEKNLNKMEQQAGELSDTISDSAQRIRSFADDQQQITAMQQGVSALTSTFTLLQGSMAALGLQSKSLLEVYAKIQIVQQSVNSLMTIYKALNKDSNLMIAARQKLEKLRLTWTKAYNAALLEQNATIAKNTVEESANAVSIGATTAAETAGTAATFSFTAALKALNATIKANPFLAVASLAITAIMGLIAIVNKFRSKAKEAEDEAQRQIEAAEKEQEAYKKRVEDRMQITDQINKKYDEEIARVKILTAVVKNAAVSYDKKRAAVAELNRLIPEFNGQIDKTGKLIRGNMSAIDDYIKKLEEKAKAEVATEMMTQAYLKQAYAQREKMIIERDQKWYQQQLKAAQDMYDLQMSLDASLRDYSYVKKAQENMEYYSRKLEATNAQIKETDKAIADANREIAATRDLVKDINPVINEPKKTTTTSPKTEKPEKPEDSEEVKAAKALYAELLKLQGEFDKHFEDLRKSAITKESEIENERYATMKARIEKAMDDIQSLLDKEPMYDANGVLINDPEKLNAALAAYKNFLKQAETEHTDTLNRIKAETNAAFAEITSKLKFDIDMADANPIEAIHLRLQNQLDALKAEEQAELESHEYTEAQKEQISQLYAQKRQKIVEQSVAEEKRAWTNLASDIISGMSAVTSSMADLFSTLAEDDEEMQKFANGLAYVDIMMSMAQGIASAVASGSGVPFPYNLAAIAAGIAAVVSGIASAISLYKKNNKVNKAPKFSTGGPVDRSVYGGMIGNKTTKRKDDTVDAKLSLGEYVIKSEIVKKYGIGFFDELNETRHRKPELPMRFAGGGTVPSLTTINQMTTAIDYSEMGEVFRDAVSEIQPVVSVREINNMQTRVSVKEQTATYN